MAAPIKQYLKNPERVGIIKYQRYLLKGVNSMKRHMELVGHPQKTSKNEVNQLNLRPIKLAEMNRSLDKIYQDRALFVTSFEEPLTGFSSLNLLGEDEDGEVIVICIYKVRQDSETCKKYAPGQKLEIVNPYHRLAFDGTVIIRVDDPETVRVVGTKLDMCRYCGEENATKRCGSCQRAKYCSKECQTLDWKTLDHQKICGNWRSLFF